MLRLPAISKQVFFVYAANGINGLLGLVVVPIGLKYLKTDGYGLLGIYLAVASYLTICDFGIAKSLIRKLAGSNTTEQRTTLLRHAVTIYALLIAGLVLLMPLVMLYLPEAVLKIPAQHVSTVRAMIGLAVLDYALSVPITITYSFCMADHRFDRYSRFTVASGISRHTTTLLAICLFRSPLAVAAGLALRRITDIAMARWLMVSIPWKASAIRLSTGAWDLAVATIRQSFTQFTLVMVLSAGTLIATNLYGLSMAGTYRATFDISTRVWFFSNAIGLVLFPYFSRLLAGQDWQRVSGRLVRYLRASWAGYMLVAVVIGIGSPYLLPLAGLRGTTNQQLFLLVLLGTCMNAHSAVSLELLQASGRHLRMAATCIASACLLLIVAVEYKTRFGIFSVGCGWLLSQCLLALVTDTLAMRALARPRSAIWRAGIYKAAALAGACVALFAQSGALLHTLITAGIVIWLAATLWLNLRNQDNRAELIPLSGQLREVPVEHQVPQL